MLQTMRNKWAIDPAHSSIFFTIRHLVVAKVRGRFSRFDGTIDLDDADLTQSSVTIEVDVASIDTAVEQRDAHLRSADFFDVEKFPKATLTSRVITRSADEYVLIGDLSLHGIVNEIALKTTFGGKTKDPRGRERMVFGARSTIHREVFGPTWNQVLEAGGAGVGAMVDLEIEVEALQG
jgi:polyisoprenoid-binding protein YceI